MKKGYITVFFALVFMVLVSFVLSVFESVKINAMKVKAECAYMAASNSLLGEYQSDLLEKFDLFYVDTAYQSGVPDYHLVEAHLWEYVEKNYQDKPLSVTISQITMATDNGGIPYRKQISDDMKDKMALSYVEELEALFREMSQEGTFGEEKEYLNGTVWSDDYWEEKQQKELAELKKIPEETWQKVDKMSPLKKNYITRYSSVLSQILPKAESVSNKKINPANYVSKRDVVSGSGTEETLDLMDKIYFVGYVFDKFSYYGAQDETVSEDGKVSVGELDYEIEYILAGSGSDYENLSQVVQRILLIREGVNLAYLLSDSEKMSILKELSMLLSAAVFCPELEPVFLVLLTGLWAYAESVADTKALMAGEKVPLFKSKADWKTDLDSGFGLQITEKSRQSKVADKGLSYKEYLEIFLFLSKEETITYRSMDLIEMHLQCTKGNESFRMDALAESFLLSIVYNLPRLGDYQVVRKFGYIS